MLRQAGVALGGRVVTLWEISAGSEAVPIISSIPKAPPADVQLDLDATLRRWGAPIIQHSRWVGCRIAAAAAGAWCIAPVRARPAAPPPRGVERRSRERLILELTGLGIGALGAASGNQRRLAPADALWELARQPSVIAHEVGNPLAVALGNLDLSVDALRSVETLDPAFRAQILDDLSHVADGIDQAAEYLRSIQDRPFGSVGRLARFDVLPIVRSCVTLERPLARKRGVGLKWDASLESIYLYGDSSSLYQVITNLIRNAVDASRGPGAVVTVGVHQLGDSLQLAVHDHGIGIAAEIRDKIFTRGFTTKPPGQGSGIGLSVVQEITQNMFGGTVQVESTVGIGSTFTLVLPIPPQRRSGRE